MLLYVAFIGTDAGLHVQLTRAEDFGCAEIAFEEYCNRWLANLNPHIFWVEEVTKELLAEVSKIS